jgi:hypothetical protein
MEVLAMKKTTDVFRIVREGKMELKADAKTVFPLLCPVREEDWIDGWSDICTIVYTDSGIAEEACVFETDIPLEGRAVWICSKYDADRAEIEYIKHIIGKAIIKWSMSVRDVSGGSFIYAVYNATGWGEKGAAYARHLGDKGIEQLFRNLEDDINNYVTNGKMKKRIINKATCHIKNHMNQK